MLIIWEMGLYQLLYKPPIKEAIIFVVVSQESGDVMVN